MKRFLWVFLFCIMFTLPVQAKGNVLSVKLFWDDKPIPKTTVSIYKVSEDATDADAEYEKMKDEPTQKAESLETGFCYFENVAVGRYVIHIDNVEDYVFTNTIVNINGSREVVAKVVHKPKPTQPPPTTPPTTPPPPTPEPPSDPPQEDVPEEPDPPPSVVATTPEPLPPLPQTGYPHALVLYAILFFVTVLLVYTMLGKRKPIVVASIAILILVVILASFYRDESVSDESIDRIFEEVLPTLINENSTVKHNVADIDLAATFEEGRNFEDVDYTGMLRIPSVEIEVPIASYYTPAALKMSPCLYSVDGPVVIAGHSYKKHFRYLRDVEIGDTVEYYCTHNNCITFTVTAVDIVDPNDAELVVHADSDLVLFTCTSDSLNRIVVYCEVDNND